LQFYVKASEQIRNRLPIDDIFLHCVAVFESKSVLFDCDRNSTFFKVIQVNSRLGGIVDEKLIQSEWKSIYEIDSLTKDEWSKLFFDDMWIKIGFFSLDERKLCFPNLRSLLSIVRTLPHSNAEAERAFSVIPDAKMRKKNKMSIETLNSISVIRYTLKDNNNTARTMTVTHEHLHLMTTKNLYKCPKSKQKSNFTLYAQGSDMT